MKATLAALAVCLLVFSSGCRGLSCTDSLSSMAFGSSHGGGGCQSGNCGIGGGRFSGGGFVDDGFVDGGFVSGGCPECGGALGRIGCGDCGLGFGGGSGGGCGGGAGCGSGSGGGLIRGGLMGCGGGGLCSGRCGGPGSCGGQLTAQLKAQLDQFKAVTARNCANGGCGLPPGPETGAVHYPYYTTRGPRDFFMCNPPSIGP